jgi:thiamine kinase-like enzyme
MWTTAADVGCSDPETPELSKEPGAVTTSLDPTLIARIPRWAAARHVEVSPLPGGITNCNLRVTVDSERFVLRIAGAHTELLGIDRRHEHGAALAAAAIGVAPEVVHYLEPEGFLVTRFIEGRALSPEELAQPGNLRRVAGALARVHAMPSIAGRFCPFRTIASCVATAQACGIEVPRDAEPPLERLAAIEAALRRRPPELRPCHNDLVTLNFLDDGTIRILDWEYAGMGDPFFDLGNFAANHKLDDAQDGLLLEYYLGSVTASARARLGLMKVVSDLREAAWGLAQAGISTLEFDFLGYAATFGARARRALDDPRIGAWLEEA